MQVRFRGTRGSIAVPGPNTLRYGGNTSCIEVRSAAGTVVVLDCGTGAFSLGQDLMAESRSRGVPLRGHLLITHTHWDHIQGIPFFAPLFVPGNEWDLYAPRGLIGSLRETLCGQMQSTYFPVTLDQLGATIRYHELVEGEFAIADIRIKTQYLNHPALTLGYRLEADGAAIVYACDHEPYTRHLATGCGEIVGRDRRHAEFLAGADLAIHDAQYTAGEYAGKAGWGHSTPEYAILMSLAARVKRLALTHHDPSRDDEAIDGLVDRARLSVSLRPEGALEVFAAAEGHLVELGQTFGGEAPHPSQTHTSAIASVGPALVGQTVVLALADGVQAAELAEAIRADGVHVSVVADARAALEAAQSWHASLVIIDRDLAGASTLDFCAALSNRNGRDSAPSIVEIVPPGCADPDHTRATDQLERPFSTVYARARIRAWLLRTACRWIRAPLPANEDRRLQALRELKLLINEPNERLNEVTRRATALFDVPIALVTLVDKDRQHIKSSCGLTELRDTSREASFCAHIVAHKAPIIVPDTLLDDRFADNPMVTGAPWIRFYAGVPLGLPNGTCAGSLCLVDNRPRYLDEAGIQLLKALGEEVRQMLSQPPLEVS